MLKAALAIASKDLKLVALRGSGLVQALLLGMLLLFLFSLSRGAGEPVSPQAAATIFWLATLFCQVLIFNALYSLEEVNAAKLGLLLSPARPHAIWLGKTMAGSLLLLCAQLVFFPALAVFLNQEPADAWQTGLLGVLVVDLGLVAMGSLLGALALGHAGKESLLSVLLFPLLAPALLAGVRLLALGLGPGDMSTAQSWLGLAAAFDLIFAAAGLVLFPFLFSADE